MVKLTMLVVINCCFIIILKVYIDLFNLIYILLCSSCLSHSNTAIIEQGIIHSCPVPSQAPVQNDKQRD